MTAPVIIDLIALAVLAGFVLWGIRRGLLRAMAGLLVMVVSLAGANLIASALSAPAAKLLAPLIEKHIEERMEETIRENLPGQMPGAMPEELEELLNLLGLDEAQRQSLGEQAQDTIRDTGVSAATAVVESMARSFLRGLLYMISFSVLTILLHMLVRMLDLFAKLPVLHGLNAFGGGVLGLLEGMLLLFLAAWLMGLLGLFPEALTESRVFSFFASYSPLNALSSMGA